MKKVNCIYLIDDNEADNEFHKIMIKEADICNQLRIFTGGQEALAYLDKINGQNGTTSLAKPDLIFLDIYMPGMTGFEFLDKLKISDATLASLLKVIVLTTSLNSDDRDKAKTYKEIIAFQNKPLTPEIAQMVSEVYF